MAGEMTAAYRRRVHGDTVRDPLDDVAEVFRVHRNLRDRMFRAVIEARRAGATWAAISEAMTEGSTRVHAQVWYRREVARRGDDPLRGGPVGDSR